MDKPFCFAIMGAGSIARKFCDAVKRVEGCTVVAVASKSKDRAQAFAKEHELLQSYGNYRQMLEAEKPDAVYIATLPNTHAELTELCLDYGIPVLCEKAMFMNGAEAERVMGRSARENVFVMEALWSRFLPAVKQAKAWLNEGRIGNPSTVEMTIGFVAPEGAENRYRNPELGGGAARDILVYAYEITTFMFEENPEILSVSAVFGDTRVDMTEHVVLRFGSVLAGLTATFSAAVDEKLVLAGDGGRIIVPHPHYGGEAFLYDAAGRLLEHFQDTETQNGFTYEIEEVIHCVADGRHESRIVPKQSTIDCARLFDQVEACRS